MLFLQNLYKTFPNLDRPILDNINLELEPGDYCMIVGNNGSGKSTLVKSITGEYNLDRGAIILDGKNLTSLPIHERSKHIATVSQNLNQGTIGELSVFENIMLSRMRVNPPSFQLACSAQEQIRREVASYGMDLERFLPKTMSSLSGGQRQVVATMMAVNPKPDLLLLDEHTSALDPRRRMEIMDFTDKLIQQNNITTLAITHNMHDAMKYGNRLIIISYGKIIYDFSAKEKAQLSEKYLIELLNEAENA